LNFLKNKKVGITGSKGKSTTTTLIYNIYKDYYPDTKIGGNITISVLEDFYPEENRFILYIRTIFMAT